jgi:hypothetical protein
MQVSQTAKEARKKRSEVNLAIQQQMDPIRAQIAAMVEASGMSKKDYCNSIGVIAQTFSRLTMPGNANMTVGSLAQFSAPFGDIEFSIRFVPRERTEGESNVTTLVEVESAS